MLEESFVLSQIFGKLGEVYFAKVLVLKRPSKFTKKDINQEISFLFILSNVKLCSRENLKNSYLGKFFPVK